MTPVTYTNLNKLLLIRDIQEIAKTYINDDRSYRWIRKNKIADVCEWAVERMENRNGTTHHYSLDEVKSIWHKYKMNDLHNAN